MSGFRAEPAILRLDLLGVLVDCDPLAHAVGFTIQLALILFGQVAIVGSHIFFLVVLQPLLAALQTCSLSRRELAVLHSVSNTILLTGFPSVNLVHTRMAWIYLSRACTRSVLGLSRGGAGKYQPARCQN